MRRLCIIPFLILLLPFGGLSFGEPVDGKDVELHRFDIVLQSIANGTPIEFSRVQSEYAPVLTGYIEPLVEDSLHTTKGKLETFANLRNIKFFYGAVRQQFSDTDSLQSALGFMKKRMESMYNLRFPEIYTIISPYNQSIILFSDSAAAIALNHYLGANYEAYSYYPNYVRRFKVKRRVVYNLAEALLKSKFQYEPGDSTLLEKMQYEGAIAAAAESVIPDFTDSLFFSFTEEQMDWSMRHEQTIWEKIEADRLLDITERSLHNAMLGAAPFAAPVSPEAPGAVGRWIGKRIVERYCEQKKCSVADFINNKLYMRSKAVLAASKYPDNEN